MSIEKIYGIHAVLAVLETSPERITRLIVQAGREDKRAQEVLELAERAHISPVSLSRQEMDDYVKDERHQGIIAECEVGATYNESDIESLLDAATTTPLILILDGVQDPHNLGACLRSANAAGAQMVIAAKDRSVGLTPSVRKVACGAAETTPFIQVTNLARTMRVLQDRGIWIYGAAGEAKSTIYKVDLKGAVALVLGAEEKGLRRLTREHCDGLATIPMTGTVSSLNVSVATGICLFEALRQRGV